MQCAILWRALWVLAGEQKPENWWSSSRYIGIAGWVLKEQKRHENNYKTGNSLLLYCYVSDVPLFNIVCCSVYCNHSRPLSIVVPWWVCEFTTPAHMAAAAAAALNRLSGEIHSIVFMWRIWLRMERLCSSSVRCIAYAYAFVYRCDRCAE